MALINRTYKFIFLAEPYSASRSVHEALMQIEGSKAIGWHHETYPSLVERWLTSDDLKLLTVAVARDPRDRLVTQYHHLTSWHEKGFDAFVRAELEHRSTIYLHTNWVDVWIPYDHLKDRFIQLLRSLDLPRVRLPYRGRTKNKRPWQEYYTPQLLEFVREKLANDFQRFQDFKC